MDGVTVNIMTGYQSDEQFSALLLSHTRLVRSLVAKYARNDPDRDDFVQETLLRAWTFRRQWQGIASFGAWIGTIARHVVWDAARKAKIKPLINAEELIGDWDDGRCREIENGILLQEAVSLMRWAAKKYGRAAEVAMDKYLNEVPLSGTDKSAKWRATLLAKQRILLNAG